MIWTYDKLRQVRCAIILKFFLKTTIEKKRWSITFCFVFYRRSVSPRLQVRYIKIVYLYTELCETV
jgi:hypothetical protein